MARRKVATTVREAIHSYCKEHVHVNRAKLEDWVNGQVKLRHGHSLSAGHAWACLRSLLLDGTYEGEQLEDDVILLTRVRMKAKHARPAPRQEGWGWEK